MAKFKILSLDGGGIRGVFVTNFLAELERSLDRPLITYFDLVAGTSTGGIIATALALGESAETIAKFYDTKGKSIFTRRTRLPVKLWWKGFAAAANFYLKRKTELDLDSIRQSKYDGLELAASLEEVFGKRTIDDAKHCRLLVPAVDLAGGRTIVFKTPHLPHAASRDRLYTASDVVLATTAAPTYFPHAVIRQGSAYCDGGLWANNPCLVAYAEALKIKECCKRDGVDPCFDNDDILMLSIGCGESPYSLAPPARGSGLGWWGSRLIEVVSQSQAQGSKWLIHHMMGDRHVRVDYPVPDKSWVLDNTGVIDRLRHIGRTTAHDELAKLRGTFFDAPTVPYCPYPVTPAAE